MAELNLHTRCCSQHSLFFVLKGDINLPTNQPAEAAAAAAAMMNL